MISWKAVTRAPALVSDVQLFEEFPSRYSADTRRRHRWMRGDWQIAAWLLPRLPGLDMRRVENPLTGLSRWKIFDNLRRSLVPFALVFLLLLGWLLFPKNAGAWGLVDFVHHRAAVAARGVDGIFTQAERPAVLFAFEKCR